MNYFDTICDTVINMLEESAFLFPDLSEENTVTEEMQSKMVGARINFSNPKSGSISVYADIAVATMIAANMIAVDEDDPQASAEAESALREFTNILAGHVVTELYGSDIVINFGLPESIDYDLSAPAPKVHMEIDVDDYKLIVELVENESI
jgi:CheY-specific phosphatase CheX